MARPALPVRQARRAALAALAIHLGCAAPPRAQERCDVRLVPLGLLTTASGETAYVDAPEPVRGHLGPMLFGQGPFLTTHVLETVPRTVLPLRIAGLAASGPGGPWRRIEAPPGASRLRWPQARSDGRRVHVVWAVGPDSGLGLVADELWHAALDSAGWSPPRLILAGRRIVREDFSTQGLALAGDTLLVATAVDGPFSGRHVAVVRLANGEWTTARIPVGRSLGYATIGQVRGELLVGYVGRDTSERGIALRVVRSADGGRSWSSPAVVSRLSDGNSTSPQFHRLDDSSLVLAWGRQRPGPFRPLSDSLALAVFRPGGRWERHAGVAVPGRFGPLLAAAGGGALHAVVRNTSDGGLLYARWSGGSWCTSPVPGISGAFTRGTLLPWDGDSLLLFWGEHADPYGAVPMTRAAVVVARPLAPALRQPATP